MDLNSCFCSKYPIITVRHTWALRMLRDQIFSACSFQDECQNYVRVLLLNGGRLFTCGTNAFMPVCTTRSITDISSVLDSVSGVARCPYDPRHNSTAMITESGEVYAATVTDFSSRDPIIYRSLGNMPPLRTAQYNSKWLNGTKPFRNMSWFDFKYKKLDYIWLFGQFSTFSSLLLFKCKKDARKTYTALQT